MPMNATTSDRTMIAVRDGQTRWLADCTHLITALRDQGWVFNGAQVHAPEVTPSDNDPDPAYSALCRTVESLPPPEFEENFSEEQFWEAISSFEWIPSNQCWQLFFV